MKSYFEEVINLINQKLDITITKQRRIILQILIDNKKQHLSVEDIYDLVKKEYQGIGMATVYRNLDLFEAKGIVDKIKLDDKAKYEFVFERRRGHHHLICKKCGKIMNAEDLLVKDIGGKLKEESNFQYIDSSVSILGYCKECNC